MTPNPDFRPLCLALFGKHWQAGCARFLKKPDGTHVNVRAVRCWAKGDTPVPFWVMDLLRAERDRRVA